MATSIQQGGWVQWCTVVCREAACCHAARWAPLGREGTRVMYSVAWQDRMLPVLATLGRCSAAGQSIFSPAALDDAERLQMAAQGCPD